MRQYCKNILKLNTTRNKQEGKHTESGTTNYRNHTKKQDFSFESKKKPNESLDLLNECLGIENLGTYSGTLQKHFEYQREIQ